MAKVIGTFHVFCALALLMVGVAGFSGCASLNASEKALKQELTRKSLNVYMDHLIKAEGVRFRLFSQLPLADAHCVYVSPLLVFEASHKIQKYFPELELGGVYTIGAAEGYEQKLNGIPRGSKILSVNGKSIRSAADFDKAFRKSEGRSVEIVISGISDQIKIQVVPIALKVNIPILLDGHESGLKFGANSLGFIHLSMPVFRQTQNADELAMLIAKGAAVLLTGQLKARSDFIHDSQDITPANLVSYQAYDSSPVYMIASLMDPEKFGSQESLYWISDQTALLFMESAGFNLERALEFWNRSSIEMKDDQLYVMGQWIRRDFTLPSVQALVMMEEFSKE